MWALVKRSDTLLFVSRGVLGFSGALRLPEQWQQGATESVRLRFFGIIPGWMHTLTFVEICDSQRCLVTQEGGGLVAVWNHRIQVSTGLQQTCIYTDDVEVRAGLFTLPVWLFAQFFYRYRQRRWRILVRRFQTGSTCP
ncbi:hypothetical protein [Parahaliea mediterranea]|uniref:hypothetical protein n=1 Tax=Parahaliea mediterranea TaxID=651086 RepID=UPI000E2F3D40|nr:hypothetical protein [Parahaliea mediterranea]